MTFPHILNQKLASPDNLLMYTTHILAWHTCYILHAGIRSNALDSNTDIARDCKAKQIVKPKRKNQVGKHNRAVYTVLFSTENVMVLYQMYVCDISQIAEEPRCI